MSSKIKNKKPIIKAEDILMITYTSYPPKEDEVKEMYSDISKFMSRKKVERIKGLAEEILSHQRRLSGL